MQVLTIHTLFTQYILYAKITTDKFLNEVSEEKKLIMPQLP